MGRNRTYISWGDFIDLYFKIRQKGFSIIISKLKWSGKARVVSKWNANNAASDFWNIPQIRKRWNEKSTGDSNLEYEDYTVRKYLLESSELRMLSIGCGTGTRERKFAKYDNFQEIIGIDIASRQVEEARKKAKNEGFEQIKYLVADFVNHDFKEAVYDLILFNSSLHHFKEVDSLLQHKVSPLLKEKGLLIIYEYVGPDRLQWTKAQLDAANLLLKEVPVKFRRRLNSRSVKRRIYRPGWLRMNLVDPSEAVDSESIVPSLHKHFTIVEEKKVGWDLTHLLFKDISHNFMNDDAETLKMLDHIMEKEDEFLSSTGRSDAIFGIYRKK